MIHLLQTNAAALEDGDLLDIQIILDPTMSTAQSLGELAIRFFLNLLVCWILVHFFYYPKSRRKDYVFTFLTFSSAMLLLLYAMGRVDVGVGLTLGLFAIFGVIRYRTETVPIREMTYLFIIIAFPPSTDSHPCSKRRMSVKFPHIMPSVGVTSQSQFLPTCYQSY